MLLTPHSSTESPPLVAKDADLDLNGARLAFLLEAFERMHASLVCLLPTTDAFAALLPKAKPEPVVDWLDPRFHRGF